MEQYRGAYNQGLLTDPMDMASFNPYAPLAAGLMFAPGSGVADVAGYAPSMTTAGEYEPSMMSNIGSGNYLDAGLQGLGLLGDAFMAAGTVVPPLIPVGAAMKAPRAARVATKMGKGGVLSDVGEASMKDAPTSFGAGAIPLTKENLQKADETTKLLVSKILEKNPDAAIGLSRSGSAAGDSNYLTVKTPDGKWGQVRVSDHGTGTRRINDYLDQLPMSAPPEGEQVFGQISRKSFDDRINKIASLVSAPPRAARVANATIGHNRPPAVVGKTPAIVPNELRGTEFKTAVLPDGSRTLIDAGGNPYIEEKTLNKLLTGVPHDRMTSEFTPPPAGTLLPEVEVRPEDFEGAWMVNLSGDRTRFGNLSKVNDIELYGDGVDLEGGNDYMRSLRAVWASAPGAVSGIENQIKAIRKGLLGGDPNAPIYGITTNMAERSGDFAVDTAETIMRMIPNSPIKRVDLKAFESSIKKKYPDYPGLANPEKALAWLTKDAHTKGAGNRRLFFVQEAAKGTNQKKGFPDIGSVRAAISEPETRFMPYGRTGAGIGLLAPEGQLAVRTRAGDESGVRLHKTYPDTVGDALGYEGGYGVTLNRSLGFPDDYALSLQMGQDPAGLRRTYDIGRKAQFMRPDVVDPQMEFIEAQKQMLRNQGILY